LHDGEHAGFGANIVAQLKATISTVTLIAPLWNTFEEAVNLETLMFKIAKASSETQEISETDKARDKYFRELRHRLKFHADDNDLPLKNAAETLLFLLKPYENAAERNLFEETGIIRNFIDNIKQTDYAQPLNVIPGLGSLVVKIETLNNRLDVLYTQRMKEIEALKTHGKRAKVRISVDHALIILLEAFNAVHRYLELSGGEPDSRMALEQSAEFITALIAQLHKVAAHRTHSRRKSEDSSKTDAPQSSADAKPSAPHPAPTQSQAKSSPHPSAPMQSQLKPDATQQPTDKSKPTAKGPPG
jgi:hypothetical protein